MIITAAAAMVVMVASSSSWSVAAVAVDNDDDDEIIAAETVDNTCTNSNTCDGASEYNNDLKEIKDEENKNDIKMSNNFESPDIDWCRRRPTWRMRKSYNTKDKDNNKINNYIRERCQEVLNYYPDLDWLAGKHPIYGTNKDNPTTNETENENDNNNDDDVKTTTADVLFERPLFRTIIRCMDGKLMQYDAPNKNVNDKMLRPKIKKVYKRKRDGLPIMSEVEYALNEIEAQSVIALSKCLKQSVKEYTFENRSFDSGGGNDVVFMAGFLQLLLPGVANQVKQVAYIVWNETKWGDDNEMGGFIPFNENKNIIVNGSSSSSSSSSINLNSHSHSDNDNDNEKNNNHEQYRSNDLRKNKKYSNKWWPDPREIGIRTIEHLSYDIWDGLGYHQDERSDYTVNILLSDPDDYEGGEFTVLPDDDMDDKDDDDDDDDDDDSSYGITNNDNDNSINPLHRLHQLHGPQQEGSKDDSKDDDSKDEENFKKITVKPDRLNAIVFLSELQHGVESRGTGHIRERIMEIR